MTLVNKLCVSICCRANETKCAIEGMRFCFTGGVACDGIENCGLAAC